ncbi:acid protease [Pleurotus eryngii]|uniref:Acid protease n=1 Tax=Pleurotus eryngii TaxID=5323 RepID=A0A9P5ZQK0_PLEER|nr:acid protease [Pleurotus eryngii]
MQLTSLLSFVVLAIVASAVPTKECVGTTIPLTKRSALVDQDGVVNIKALQNQILRVSSKLNRGFAAFEKNTGTLHPNDIRNITKRATGADPLTDDQEALWQGAISVGTPAKTFTVDFDTGSSDLFLPASNCAVNCAGHTLWTTGASSTSRNAGRSFSLAFGDGSTVSGTVFSDTVTVAGLTATSQAVGAATRYSTGFAKAEFPPDGLMGMAFPQISEFGANPVFQTLVAQGKTTASEFAFKLATSGSELFLGGVNSNLFTGAFTQNRVTSVGFWQIALGSANVNGAAVVSGGQAIVDTGTTLLLGPASAVSRFYAAIPGARDATNTVGAGFFTFPCNSLPPLSLTLGGRAFPISAASFNLGTLSAGSTTCVGGVASVDFDNMWILGDVFLENVYTSFNTATQQVGFATLR